VTLDDPVLDIQLDPDHWILRDLTTIPVGDDDMPVSNILSQNFPNPFNPSTTISFSLEKSSDVTLRIYDTSGARIYTLASGSFPAGTFDRRWNGMNDRGEKAASGVYFYRLTAGDFIVTRKMVLLR